MHAAPQTRPVPVNYRNPGHRPATATGAIDPATRELVGLLAALESRLG